MINSKKKSSRGGHNIKIIALNNKIKNKQLSNKWNELIIIIIIKNCYNLIKLDPTKTTKILKKIVYYFHSFNLSKQTKLTYKLYYYYYRVKV